MSDGVPGATTAPDPHALLALGITAAEDAGALILDYLDRMGRKAIRDAAEVKSSTTDLVTQADRGSERLIVDRLLGVRPDDGIIGEEGSERQGSSGITWVIDPIDGTTNFVYRYPAFSISIAACDDSGTVVGVVHDPLRKETFTAIRDQGCWLNGAPIPVVPTLSPPLEEALIATGFSYSSQKRAAQAALLLGVLPNVRDIRRGGSAALDLCSVAVGRVDAYYEAGLARWDREAGVLIAREAGLLIDEDGDLLAPDLTLIVAPPGLLAPFRALLAVANERVPDRQPIR
jgi:myo-inositol-1(or 4)-monophosphatase